ncbi:phage tail fiber protein [Acinetobacter colistiniresistens]|uniref:phage tail fiber protein n=1 Tax=Acinetobacter colistiniresistens TaxID=280145 RepID=UPI0012503692|nr:hypothetical protein [Acinetobacter colistiniresistens]
MSTITTVESIAELTAIQSPVDGQTFYVKSYHAGLGQGGGHFSYNPNRVSENDFGLIIKGWIRQNVTYVTPEMFGAKADGIEDDYKSLQASLSAKKEVRLNAKNYRTSKPLEMFTNTILKGVSQGESKIIKYSASTTGISGRTDPNGNSYNYDQDCAVVFAAWFGWYSYIDIENVEIVKEPVNGKNVGKVFFAPYISKSTIKNLVVKGGEYGIYTEDIWMMNWNRCESYSKCGWYLGTGTSNTLIDCWSKETEAGYSSYRIHNMTYSSLINCCAESVGKDGAPADAAYHITNSDLIMAGCGIENCHAYNLIRIGYSWINIQNPSFIYGINNKYRHLSYTGLFDISHPDSVVTLEGGRISSINTETFADAARVDGSTFNFKTPLWSGVNMPDSNAQFKIRVSNWAAILDIKTFDGEEYKYNGRGKLSTILTPTKLKQKSSGANGIDLNDLRTDLNKFFLTSDGSGSTVARNYPFASFGGHILNLADDSDSPLYTNAVQVAFPINSNSPYWRRAGWSENYTPWMKFLTSANTTVDANGFIKAASPIVKLFSHRIEVNDEALTQNPEFERIGVGHYLIKNTLGFAQDSWWIEIPKDANGNVLVAVVYEQLSNKDISISTYAKKFDKETGDVVPNLSN